MGSGNRCKAPTGEATASAECHDEGSVNRPTRRRLTSSGECVVAGLVPVGLHTRRERRRAGPVYPVLPPQGSVDLAAQVCPGLDYGRLSRRSRISAPRSPTSPSGGSSRHASTASAPPATNPRRTGHANPHDSGQAGQVGGKSQSSVASHRRNLRQSEAPETRRCRTVAHSPRTRTLLGSSREAAIRDVRRG